MKTLVARKNASASLGWDFELQGHWKHNQLHQRTFFPLPVLCSSSTKRSIPKIPLCNALGLMHNMCKCQQYDDLNLVQEEMINREWAYEEIVSDLKQKCQKLVERWLEHYRLYQCSECGQFWQSSICIRGRFDTPKLLYKVPPIKTSEWKTKPYVAPDCILIFGNNKQNFYPRSSNFLSIHVKLKLANRKQ